MISPDHSQILKYTKTVPVKTIIHLLLST